MDSNGRTPPSYAAVGEKVKVMENLLDVLGIDVNSKDKYSRTPLHLAVLRGNEGVLRPVIELTIEIRLTRKTGPTSEAFMEPLLKIGKGDINIKDHNSHTSRTPLHFAVMVENVSVLKLLLQGEGIDMDWKQDTKLTPSMPDADSKRWNEKVVLLLIATGKCDVGPRTATIAHH